MQKRITYTTNAKESHIGHSRGILGHFYVFAMRGVCEVSEHSRCARAMKKADAITYLSKCLQEEQDRAHTLYCRYYALYDLCQEITMFGYDREAERRLIELVRKEALEE